MSDNSEPKFEPSSEASFQSQKKIRDNNQYFIEEQLRSFASTRIWRNVIASFVGLLLVTQYYFLYKFLKIGFDMFIVEDLQWLYIGLLGGLLLETYFLAKLIVRWVFTDRPYKPDVTD